MLETRVSSNVTLGDIEIPAMALHRAYAQTEWGVKLAQQTRYTPFKPDSVSNEEWKQIFGADVNNLDHMALSLGITRSFLDHCANPRDNWQGPVPEQAQLTRNHNNKVLITSVTHDWAESVVGDIPYHDKTKNHHAIEMDVLADIMNKVFKQLNPAMDTQQIIEDVIRILDGKDEKLSPIFDSIERIGYVRTSLTGARKMHKPEISDEAKIGIKGVAVTGPFHIPTLTRHAEIYPATDAFLKTQKPQIGEVVSLAFNSRETLSRPTAETIDHVVDTWSEYDSRTSILLPHGQEVFINRSN